MIQNTTPNPKLCAHFSWLDHIMFVIVWSFVGTCIVAPDYLVEQSANEPPVMMLWAAWICWIAWRFGRAAVLNIKPTLFVDVKNVATS